MQLVCFPNAEVSPFLWGQAFHQYPKVFFRFIYQEKKNVCCRNSGSLDSKWTHWLGDADRSLPSVVQHRWNRHLVPSSLHATGQLDTPPSTDANLTALFFKTKTSFECFLNFSVPVFCLKILSLQFLHETKLRLNLHRTRDVTRTQIGTFFLWCCLRAVWTLPLTITGPICLRCGARRVPRPVWIDDSSRCTWEFVCLVISTHSVTKHLGTRWAPYKLQSKSSQI